MNLIRHARVALAAAVLAGGVLGSSVAPTFADSTALQPTQIVFTSSSATRGDPAKAFATPGTPIGFYGFVSPSAEGTVKMFDSVWDGSNVQTDAIATGLAYYGRFVVAIPATRLSTGTHLLTAVYLGNDRFAPSNSPVFTEVITSQPVTDPNPNLQPTQIAFTSPSATQDPAMALNTAGTQLSFGGVVSPNASGEVIMFDAEPDGGDAIPIAVVPVTDGQFSVTIFTNGNNGITDTLPTPTSLGSGTHLLTAVYLDSGNHGFAPSSSPVFTEVIQAPAY